MGFSKKILVLAASLIMTNTAMASSHESVISEAVELRDKGEFEKASRVLQTWLEQNDEAQRDARRSVEFEIERMRRIRLDYQTTRDRLITQLQDRLTTFTADELDNYEREGKLDVQLIDGQKLYVNTSASNLILSVPELRERRKKNDPVQSYKKLYDQMKLAKKASELTSLTLVLPQDWRVDYRMTVEANAAPEGKIVRAWLPFVNQQYYQADLAILETTPSITTIAPPQYPHRTIYMEEKAVKDQPTEFALSFVYRTWARVNDLDPKKVLPYDKSAPDYAFYTAERKPHIDFSAPELQRISNEIRKGDTNPLLMTRRIYDWIADNTIYQYAREYSTIDNISAYVAGRRAGDCGQHGMLFIALCRMNGIPARWATGWESFADFGQNLHDWCEFYVEPYGWLPADPDMAVNITHYADILNEDQRKELRDWFFGNMDNYRLTVNTDYGQPLYPPKEDFRSETVDFQRGEVESDGKNIYFNKFKYRLRFTALDPGEAEKLRQQAVPLKD